MARVVRDSILDTRTARARLKPRGKPYYRTIDPGLHLGYRRSADGGKWVVRVYLGSQSYRVDTLATADDRGEADGLAVLNFAQAQARARARLVEITRDAAGLPTAAGPYTVRSAIEEYLEWSEQHRKSARGVRWTAEAFILPKLGAVEIAKLTATQIGKWLKDLAAAPPRLRSKRKGAIRHSGADLSDAEARRRRRSSANRILTTLKAALNRAWREGRVASDDAWRRVRPFPDADAARARYLQPPECKRLINASAPPFREMVRAALMTGCRYSELAAFTVDDFNPDSRTIAVRQSKTGKPRHVVLTDEAVELFQRLALGRAGDALLLVRPDGSPWTKSAQMRPMRAACAAAKIVPPINFHGLRHTWASHTVMNGAPLFVVAKNLGHTDTRMVERHYGHLAPSFIADAIRAAAPTFGIATDHKVASLRSRRKQ